MQTRWFSVTAVFKRRRGMPELTTTYMLFFLWPCNIYLLIFFRVCIIFSLQHIHSTRCLIFIQAHRSAAPVYFFIFCEYLNIIRNPSELINTAHRSSVLCFVYTKKSLMTYKNADGGDWKGEGCISPRFLLVQKSRAPVLYSQKFIPVYVCIYCRILIKVCWIYELSN